MGTTSRIRGLLSGTRELRGRVSETAARDTLLLQQGNAEYCYHNLIMRRRVAALAMQHREAQRLDKEIALLRAALGLPQMDPDEVIRTHVTARDPLTDTSLASAETAASPYDSEWARGGTARGPEWARDTPPARRSA